MNAREFLKSKNIYIGSNVADENAPENYFRLEYLLEEYHESKVKLEIINLLQGLKKWNGYSGDGGGPYAGQVDFEEDENDGQWIRREDIESLIKNLESIK